MVSEFRLDSLSGMKEASDADGAVIVREVLEPYLVKEINRHIDWLIERIHHQQDQGPLEDLARWFRIAGHPKQALISVGATRYTDFGETHFLQAGDRSVVVLYDGQAYDTQRIEDLLLSGESTDAIRGAVTLTATAGMAAAGIADARRAA